MVPVFWNFTNKHTKKYYEEGKKQQVLKENTRGLILGQGWGQERLPEERTLEL